MSRLLTRKGFFSPSTFALFTVNGTEWITDAYTLARADFCSDATTRNVAHMQEVNLSIVALLATDPLMPITDHSDVHHGLNETSRNIGAGNLRGHHDPSTWAAWMRTGATPHLAIVGGTDAVVMWTARRRTVGFTALRRWSA